MKKQVKLFIAILTVAALPAAVFAHASTTAKPRPALLYRITGKGLQKPSYIFGTIHLACPQQMLPMDKLKGYLGQTEQLVTEIDLGDMTQMSGAAAQMMNFGGPSLKQMMTPEQFDKVAKLMNDQLGLKPAIVEKMPPQVLQLMLVSSPKVIGCTSPQSYELELTAEAKNRNMSTVGLETVDQQISMLGTQPVDKQVKALVELADHPEKMTADFQKLVTVYGKQDVEALFRTMAKQQKPEDAELYVTLLEKRNAAWVPRLEELMTAKSSFIAVGGGHLGGKTGVLSLLRKKGYKLEPVRL